MRLICFCLEKGCFKMTSMKMINEITKTFKSKEEKKRVYFSLLFCNKEQIEKLYNEIVKK